MIIRERIKTLSRFFLSNPLLILIPGKNDLFFCGIRYIQFSIFREIKIEP
jgi:hypothetical protein